MDATDSASVDGSFGVTAVATTVTPPRKAPARTYVDSVYHGVSLLLALGVVVTLIAVVAMMVGTAWPAIGRYGLGFFTSTVWNTSTNAFGALPFIVGTLATTALALIVAVPISIAIALLLVEYTPKALSSAIGVAIDVAAGVPTIVFGVWGLLVLVPWLHYTALPALSAGFGWLPPLNPGLHPSDLSGYGMFTAALVLAAMIFPTIVAVSRGSLAASPPELRDASLALGATRWETATRVILRQARGGVLGAIVLACGRALGETMAVVYVIGTVPRLPRSLFDQGYTLATELLTQVYGGGAVPGTLYNAVLYELGVVLLGFSLLASLAGRFLTRRLAGAIGSVGGMR